MVAAFDLPRNVLCRVDTANHALALRALERSGGCTVRGFGASIDKEARSPVVAVMEISSNDVPELALVQSDDMIEAVVWQGSDEPRHERLLPRLRGVLRTCSIPMP